MTESVTDRDPLELLAAEFTDRCRRGQHPSVDDYAREHPELADEIRELFPTIAAIEQVKSASPGQNIGGPVRGGLSLERLGDFRIIRELGRGGMGVVYEAEQESLGRRVALKVLPRQLLLHPEQLNRFEREARTAAALHHTNIVPIFGVGAHDGYHYIVMQYIRGVGLDVVLRELRRVFKNPGAGAATASCESASGGSRTGIDALSVARSLARDASAHAPRPTTESRAPSATPTPQSDGGRARSNREQRYDGSASEDESCSHTTETLQVGPAYWRSVARMAMQIADALEYAHGQGTLHRDIKPGNLLVDADGTVWVADFGLAKALDHDGVTQTGGVVGTWRYMAPEQYQGNADARSDVYSLGLTLYELATLRPAFVATSRTTLINAITRGALDAPRQLRPDMPRDLETIILKSIAREPDARYASAAALATDLRRFLEDRPILARRATIPERVWRWSRRNPALAALGGAAAALLIAVAAISTAAYMHTSQANRQVRNALDGEQSQRLKAEATSELATEVLDTIFEQFAPTRTRAASTFTVDGSAGTQIEVPTQPVLSPETATLLEHMLGFYRRLAAQEGADPAIRLKIAEANRRVGDIHHRLGHFEDAHAAYARAIELFENLGSDGETTPTNQVALAHIHNELGTILIAQEHGEDGRTFLEKAREILEAAQATPSYLPAVRFELARTCYLLARAPRPPIPTPQRGEPGLRPPPDGRPPPPPGAHRPAGPDRRPPDGPHPRDEYFDEGDDPWSRAVEILTELSAAYPDAPDYRHLLALCYRDMPPPRPSPADDRPSPLDAVTRAIEILQQLASDFSEVPAYRYDLSETYAMSAVPDLCPGPAPYAIEEQRLRAALEISEQLVAERPNIPAYTVSQVHIRLRFADFLRRRSQSDAAEEQLQTARTLQVALAQRFPDTPTHQVFVAVIEGALARLLRDCGRFDEARTRFEEALAVLHELPDDWRRPPYVRDVLVATYTGLAGVHRRLGDHAAAAEAARQAEQYRLER